MTSPRVVYLILALASLVASNQLHKNVLGTNLETCSLSPITGFTRTGRCETHSHDYGTHLVCAQVTREFLEYTKSRGNDLSSPRGRWFPGLKPANRWCLCVFRWYQAYVSGVAPPVVLNATHHNTLGYIKRYGMNLTDLSRSGYTKSPKTKN